MDLFSICSFYLILGQWLNYAWPWQRKGTKLRQIKPNLWMNVMLLVKCMHLLVVLSSSHASHSLSSYPVPCTHFLTSDLFCTDLPVWRMSCQTLPWPLLVILLTPYSLVVRRPPWERKIPGSNPACAGIFSGWSHTSDLKIGTPVATLPGAWCDRVSTGTGRPGVSILWLGEVEHLVCNFCLSVTARRIVCADPSLRYISLLLGC